MSRKLAAAPEQPAASDHDTHPAEKAGHLDQLLINALERDNAGPTVRWPGFDQVL
jgi:hypothetical protein